MAKLKKADEDIEVAIPKDYKFAFTKAQLLKSERFKDCRDLINAIFEEDKLYTIEEAIKLTDDFKKKGVK